MRRCYVGIALMSELAVSQIDLLPAALAEHPPAAIPLKQRARRGTLHIPVSSKTDKSAYMKAWRVLHKEQTKQYNKHYRTVNRESVRAQEKLHRAAIADRIKAYNRQYWAAHRERLLIRFKARVAAEPKKYAEIFRASFRKHRVRVNARSLAYSHSHADELRRYRNRPDVKARTIQRNLVWVKSHPYMVRATNHRRRARLKNAGGANYTTGSHIEARWAMWGGNCWICGDKATATDHIIPLKKGGSHWPSNLRPICKSCNGSIKITHWREKSA